jgi:hypothetical protein
MKATTTLPLSKRFLVQTYAMQLHPRSVYRVHPVLRRYVLILFITSIVKIALLNNSTYCTVEGVNRHDL